MVRQYKILKCLECNEEFNYLKSKYDKYLADVVKGETEIEFPECISCGSKDLGDLGDVELDLTKKEGFEEKHKLKDKIEDLEEMATYLEKYAVSKVLSQWFLKVKTRVKLVADKVNLFGVNVADSFLEAVANFWVVFGMRASEHIGDSIVIEIRRVVKFLTFLIYWWILTRFINFPVILTVDYGKVLIFLTLVYWFLVRRGD